jgi:hypothetical protein
MTPTFAQTGFAPAGGAPLLQVVLATVASLLAFVPLTVVVLLERSGRPTLAGRLADFAGSLLGMPRWLALPMLLQVASLASAGLGVYWDVPWHADLGRDEGPLANPAHYLILAGLLGVFASGVLAAALATRELPTKTVRIGPGWRVPAGAVVIMISGLVALSGFPLDDVWHRLFGQDVTEWGPTHVLMIGGAVGSLLGTMLLAAEATQVRGRTTALRYAQLRLASLWLIGLTVFLMEYEVGVPQFPMVAHTVLLVIAATWALCYARATFGPGGALLAVALYLVVRVLFLVITGPVLGRTAAHFSLYVVPALLVELLPLLVPIGRRIVFGAIAGALVGSLGVLAEAAWTHVFFPLPWPTGPDGLGRLVGYGLLAGIGAGLVAGWQLSRLDAVSSVSSVSSGSHVSRPQGSRAGTTHRLGLLGAALVVLAMVLAIPRDADQRLTGELTLQHVDPGNALVTVRLADPGPVRDAVWFHTLAWQGGGRVLAPMERVDAGLYRTTRPVPVDGTWKTLVRLHVPDDDLVALPVYLPADPAIPADETPAASGVTRAFEPEQHILQREAKRGLPGWMWALGYGAVFGVAALALAVVASLYTKAASPGRRREPAGPLRSSDPART